MSRVYVNRDGGDTIWYTKVAGVATEIMRVTQAGNMTVPGTFKATVGVTGIGAVPVGSIMPILVDSPITGGGYTIPATGTVDSNGWQLCDGAAIPGGNTLSGVTPNLSGGVYLRGSTVSGGALGGSNTLTAANLPSHSHAVGTLVNTPESGHTHSVTSNVSASTSGGDGCHYHNIGIYRGAQVLGNPGQIASGCTGTPTSTVTDTSGAHGHSISVSNPAVTSGTGSSHNHTISGSTDTTGSGTTGNNEPQYMNVRYLIRVK